MHRIIFIAENFQKIMSKIQFLFKIAKICVIFFLYAENAIIKLDNLIQVLSSNFLIFHYIQHFISIFVFFYKF